MVSDFSDYCWSSLENEDALAIERREHFTDAATERFTQVCVWQLLLKSFKYVCEGVKLKKH